MSDESKPKLGFRYGRGNDLYKIFTTDKSGSPMFNVEELELLAARLRAQAEKQVAKATASTSKDAELAELRRVVAELQSREATRADRREERKRLSGDSASYSAAVKQPKGV